MNAGVRRDYCARCNTEASWAPGRTALRRSDGDATNRGRLLRRYTSAATWTRGARTTLPCGQHPEPTDLAHRHAPRL